jgi:hypothetical protein
MILDQLFLGGCEFRLTGDGPLPFALPCDPVYQPFGRMPSTGAAGATVHTVQVRGAQSPLTADWVHLADSPAWTMAARGAQRSLALLGGGSEPPALRFDLDGEASELCWPALANASAATVRAHPFRYPLDQMRLMYLLARHQGFVVHAAGAVLAGRGILLAGRSGAGKSTLTRLLQAAGAHALLSDDRVIVRGDGPDWWAYGTPWPGDARVANNERAPLRALCFLQQSATDALVPVSPAEAVHRLLAVASIPWFDAAAFPQVLAACEQAVKAVPAFDLCFRPTPAIVSRLAEAAGRLF